MAAIDAAQLVQQLARRGGLQTQDAVHIDRQVHGGTVELVEFGIQRRLRIARGDLQGIEIGFQMPDHAIGADHLDGMDGMFGRFGVSRRRRSGGGLALTGLARGNRRLLAGQGGDQVACRNLGPGVTLPGGSAAKLGRGKTLLAGLAEIGLPARVHRIGVGLPGGVHLLDIGGVGAVEEGCRFENLIRGAVQFVSRGLFSHFRRLWGGLLGLPLPGGRNCGVFAYGGGW
jgi:hypothetical protein